MKTTYLAWKDPFCGGINPEWQELSGKEFYTLVKSPEGKNRCFVKLESHSSDDSMIVMEATLDDYRKWRKEKDHDDFIHESNHKKGYVMVSYNALDTETGDFNGEEILRDDTCDVEEHFLSKVEIEAVRAAVSKLSAEEQRMIEYLYLSDEPGTERGYSVLTGIPQKTINDRKNLVLARLKKLLKK